MEAEIGIIGGSGFYSLLEKSQKVEISTEYGNPSDKISIGQIAGRSVAFLPRHGSKHTIPPHLVPYRANIQALHKLGVRRILATNATGSLNPEFRIGEIVLFDQFVNMTHGRKDTFFDGEEVAHVSTADPYCDELRLIASDAAKKLKLDYKDRGSVLVINGPRFSTKAESRFFIKQGFDLINMTQYPEVALAKEKGMCYVGIGMVTDYDAGIVGEKNVKPVTHAEVVRTFEKNIGNVKHLVTKIIENVPNERGCSCSASMDSAIIRV
jgi:5'-methylthioadenosine phosphorylase